MFDKQKLNHGQSSSNSASSDDDDLYLNFDSEDDEATILNKIQ